MNRDDKPAYESLLTEIYAVLRELADAERAKTDPVDAMVKARADIRAILSAHTAPPAASGQKLTEAIEALACPATNHCSRPELFEQGFECARSMAADLIRASSATASDKAEGSRHE